MLRHQESFQMYAEIYGALIATILELHKRKGSHYEDVKRITNGDLSDFTDL